MRFVILLLVGSAMLPTLAFGISRIGGGKISSERSLFEADLSMWYQEVETGNRKIKLYSSAGVGAVPGSLSGKILIAEFSDIYPAYTGLEREDIAHIFFGRGYSLENEHFKKPKCVDIYYQVFQQNIQYILTWGSGRGIHLTLTKDGQTQAEGLRIVRSLGLLEGACVWN